MRAGVPILETMEKRPLRRPPLLRRPRVCAALLLLSALVPAGPLGADTLLISTEETVEGSPCPPPLPGSEGLSAVLFERGHIVFDAGQPAPPPDTAELLELARSGGAAWVLEAVVSFFEAPRGIGPGRITATADWTLIRAESGSTAARGKARGSNEARERDVDRAGLAMELGAAIADEIAGWLAGGG